MDTPESPKASVVVSYKHCPACWVQQLAQTGFSFRGVGFGFVGRGSVRALGKVRIPSRGEHSCALGGPCRDPGSCLQNRFKALQIGHIPHAVPERKRPTAVQARHCAMIGTLSESSAGPNHQLTAMSCRCSAAASTIRCAVR